jgi:hypothetical protein
LFKPDHIDWKPRDDLPMKNENGNLHLTYCGAPLQHDTRHPVFSSSRAYRHSAKSHLTAVKRRHWRNNHCECNERYPVRPPDIKFWRVPGSRIASYRLFQQYLSFWITRPIVSLYMAFSCWGFAKEICKGDVVRLVPRAPSSRVQGNH